jgi:lysophospholipase L1-like esterase
VNRSVIVGVVVFVALVGAAFWYFSDAKSLLTNYPSDGTDIVAFGDSLIQGVGSTDGHDLVSDLSARIGQPIVNLGVSGNTTAQGLARISELDRYDPKVVILLLGGNDFLQKVPQSETFANLAQIIQNIQGRGAIVLLLGVRGGVLSDPFAAEYQQLASTYHTAYVSNVLKGLLGHPDLMSDEVHPNDAGYAEIADRVAPVLQKLLQ